MSRVAGLSVVVLVIVGVFAPILATELPVAAKVDGELRFPAFAAWIGEAPASPRGETWAEWWSVLPDNGDDWVMLAPVPFDPRRTDRARFYAPPSLRHPCGNDDTGRDVLARLVHGCATAVEVAASVVLLAAILGILAGALAGYFGGWVDSAFLRVLEVFLCFPALIAVMAVAAFVAGSQLAIVLVLVSVYWVSFARIVRGEFLSLREREFVQAARGLGVGTVSLIVRHMLPSVRGPVLVVAAFVAGNAIVVESTLRFLGLGSASDAISWGGMLAQFRSTTASAWHIWAFPALVIAATVLALHRVADRGHDRSARSSTANHSEGASSATPSRSRATSA